MNAEFFKIIKEINSLELKAKSVETLKVEDKKRMDRLYEHKENRQEDLNTYISELNNFEKRNREIDYRVQDIQKSLEDILFQKNSVFEEQLQRKLEENEKILIDEKDTIENEAFDNLEKIEELDQEIKNAQNFLRGIDETIDEILNEVKTDLGAKNLNIEKINERIDEILNDLSEEFKNKYLKLKDKAPLNSPLSILNENRCSQCGFQVPAQAALDIENLKLLDQCQMCYRILIPSHSSY